MPTKPAKGMVPQKAMNPLKAKICLVGEAAVGKTSLIRRYVVDEFDDNYLMTLGAKVTKKPIDFPPAKETPPAHLELMIWDVMGQPKFRELLEDVYFHGASGILAVADVTRRETLDALFEWIDRVDRVTSGAPVILAVNKSDLKAKAQFGEAEIERLAAAFHGEFLMTSAKTGANVEEAFRRLGARVLERIRSTAFR